MSSWYDRLKEWWCGKEEIIVKPPVEKVDNYLKLHDKIIEKTASVLVIGAGYVGLPLGVATAKAGYSTFIYDISEEKIKSINEGKSYIEDISSVELKNVVDKGKLIPMDTIDWLVMAYGRMDVIVICVPTPLNKTNDPDTSYILDAVVEAVDCALGPEALWILESTVYPGFTREVLFSKLEEFGYFDEDCFIAFSPERIDPGNEKYNLITTPKLVGGVSARSGGLATAFYKQFIDEVIQVSSSEVAEAAKILENTFRMINIGFANEMAIACNKMGINVWEVIEAANTKPFGFMQFTPGNYGGHCISSDPHYLSWKTRSLDYQFKFIDLAQELNMDLMGLVEDKIIEGLNKLEKSIKGSNILLLGASYKPNISDTREAIIFPIIDFLKKREGNIFYHDPYVPELLDLKSVELEGKYDCVVILTAHENINYDKLFEITPLIVDTKNVLSSAYCEENNIIYLSI